MRREIIRSLVVWPAAASATIIAWTWLGTPDGSTASFLSSQARRLLIASLPRAWPEPIEPVDSPQPELAPVDLTVGFVTMESPQVMADLPTVERTDQGSRAMKLPSRLVDVLTLVGSRTSLEHAPRLIAPIRNEQHEIAGLVLRPPREVQANSSPGQPVVADVTRDIENAANSRVDSDNSRSLGGAPVGDPAESVAPNASDSTRNTQPSEARRLDTTSTCPQPLLVEPMRQAQIAPPAAADMTHSLLPKSIRTLGELDTSAGTRIPESQVITDAAPRMTVADIGSPPPDRHDVSDSPAGWPITAALDEQLQSLVAPTSETLSASHGVSSLDPPRSTLGQWTANVRSHLSQLRTLPRIGHPQAGALISSLADLAEEGLQRAETMDDRALQIRWLQTCHALARRAAIWEPIWQISSSAGPTRVSDDEAETADPSIHATLDQLRREVVETRDQSGWTRYLMLDQLESLADRGEFEERQITAQRFLSRLDWHGLKSEQQQWLDRPSVDRLAELVRPWARSAVDYASLLNQLERQESNAIDLAAIDISGAIQSLRFAESPNAVRVAAALNTHYRNANIRTAISQAMLQRMLPTVEPQTVSVRTRMFGSRIRGVSQIDSELDIALTPSPDRWTLQLRTLGNVRSASTGVNGPVAIRTGGNSNFTTATAIEVTPRGVRIGDSTAEVQGANRLRSVKTDYDGWPLLGSLVKGYAESRYHSVAPRSNRITNRLIREQIVEEVDNQLEQKVAVATEQLGEMVLGPLGKLRLDPRVIDLQTTQQRLLARYRLAGDWQLGAFTPRPRAPRSSLMSLQVHQSALNNTLEQLVPHDELTSIRDMVRQGLETFGFTAPQIPGDIREDVKIQFAPTRPVTVEIEDGQFWVTMRVVRLTGKDRLDLRRFIVRALYKPQVDGLNARLVRDGHLRISGPGMSMRQRLPVRAIFNKVLSPNRPLQLTLPQLVDHPAAAGLAISQLELRDGWIALAISETDAPRIDSLAWLHSEH
jgi:hypothetical protein